MAAALMNFGDSIAVAPPPQPVGWQNEENHLYTVVSPRFCSLVQPKSRGDENFSGERIQKP